MKEIMFILFLLIMSATVVGGQTIDPQTEILEHRIARSGLSAEDARSLVHSMQQAGFTEEQAERLARQLAAHDFPGMAAEPVRDKVLEGIAKRVSAERVLQAATTVEERYAHAYELTAGLAQQNRMRLTQAYADCLAAGLTREDAARIASAIESRRQQEEKTYEFGLGEETLLTAREMVRQGAASATTASVIGEALARGYDESNMHTLRNSLRNTQRNNLEETAQKYRAAIGMGVSADKLGSYQGGGNVGGAFQGRAGSDSGHGNDSAGGQGSGSSGGGSNGSGSSGGSSGSGSSGGSSGSGSSGGSSGSGGASSGGNSDTGGGEGGRGGDGKR